LCSGGSVIFIDKNPRVGTIRGYTSLRVKRLRVQRRRVRLKVKRALRIQRKALKRERVLKSLRIQRKV
jgi:hypothetical protein